MVQEPESHSPDRSTISSSHQWSCRKTSSILQPNTQKVRSLLQSTLQEFLIMYRRTPLFYGYSPSELLNGRQLRIKFDPLLPLPVYLAQSKQMKDNRSTKTVHHCTVGTPCYALYCLSKRDTQPKLVEAVVIKVFGSRTVNVRILPRGPIWKRHLEQLCPRHASPENAESPAEVSNAPSSLPKSQPLPAATDCTKAEKTKSKIS
ncbi:uncharacterized protein [Watersipora subatra]|uniref:uncharacterized protein n=1 Tax=Watersipora subatra TaxID=2589382 RepID=UPI00355B4AA4